MSGDKDKYLSLSNEIDDLKYSGDGIEKTKAGLKIIGKSIFNIGKYATTEVFPEMVSQAEAKKK